MLTPSRTSFIVSVRVGFVLHDSTAESFAADRSAANLSVFSILMSFRLIS
ncbi:MAG: hypothetical protein BWY89_01398 [Bacteroidetes bacterium ADurb.BinA012]|nr:MAG: hypothetical protein BWY89_01398 [Bacteroidetes bacterium ADurb.BinA012]